MNDATLKQATATARDAAEDLKDIAKDVRERAATSAAAGGARVAEDLKGTAKDMKGAAKDAGDAAGQVEDVARAARVASRDPDDLDDIERIEQRMNARRQSIRRHLDEARDNVGRTVSRTTRSWPIVVGGVALAAVAVGYAVAQRNKPSSRAQRAAKSMWHRAREAPEAARRYVHEATKPPGRVWTERAGAAAGFAVAMARALPQIRALVAGIQAGRRATRH